MQRRRGLVSQQSKPTVSHATAKSPAKRAHGESESESDLSSSSSVSDSEIESKQEDHSEKVETVQETGTVENAESSDKKSALSSAPPAGKQKNKEKRDYSDTNKWKKVKIKGTDKEVMVDLKKCQKYIDYDSTTVQSFQAEIEAAKGNFRQQQMTDYSDL